VVFIREFKGLENEAGYERFSPRDIAGIMDKFHPGQERFLKKLVSEYPYNNGLHIAKALDKNRDDFRWVAYDANKPNYNDGEKTPLMWAIKQGNPEYIRELLKRGADPYSKDSCGRTAYDYVEQCEDFYGIDKDFQKEFYQVIEDNYRS